MDNEKTSVMDDIKSCKGYILGVIAFATTVAGFLTQVFHFKPEPTITAVSCFAVLVLYMGLLIRRSEQRQTRSLIRHEKWAEKQMDGYDEKLDKIIDFQKENQRSLIRIEMNQLIEREPYNHDTIIAYAERYFLELSGDWKQTDKFLDWVEKENKEGRSVHIPSELFVNVHTKHTRERMSELNNKS